jgi:RNA polymerase-binding protein DksA
VPYIVNSITQITLNVFGIICIILDFNIEGHALQLAAISKLFKKTTDSRKADTEVAKKTKKVSKKKTSKKGKRLTKTELNDFKELLLKKRAEILSDVSKIENESLRKSRLDATGDLSNVPIHMADIGTDNYEQEFALDLMDSERKLLDEIHRALERIEDGTYGICEGTGKSIPKVRLKAQPWAKYCVEYARMIEQGLVSQ